MWEMRVVWALEMISGLACLPFADLGVYSTKGTTHVPLLGTFPNLFSRKSPLTPLNAAQHGTSVGDPGSLRSLPIVPRFSSSPACPVF